MLQTSSTQSGCVVHGVVERLLAYAVPGGLPDLPWPPPWLLRESRRWPWSSFAASLAATRARAACGSDTFSQVFVALLQLSFSTHKVGSDPHVRRFRYPLVILGSRLRWQVGAHAGRTEAYAERTRKVARFLRGSFLRGGAGGFGRLRAGKHNLDGNLVIPMAGSTTTSFGSSAALRPQERGLRFEHFYLNGRPGVDAPRDSGLFQSTPAKVDPLLDDVGFKGQLKACPFQRRNQLNTSGFWRGAEFREDQKKE